jgi:hypothetical protein
MNSPSLLALLSSDPYGLSLGSLVSFVGVTCLLALAVGCVGLRRWKRSAGLAAEYVPPLPAMPLLSVGQRSGSVVRLVDIRTLSLSDVESWTEGGDDPTAEPAPLSDIVPSLEAIPLPVPVQEALLAKPARASAAAAGSHVVRVVPAAHRGATFRPAPEVLRPVTLVSASPDLRASLGTSTAETSIGMPWAEAIERLAPTEVHFDGSDSHAPVLTPEEVKRLVDEAFPTLTMEEAAMGVAKSAVARCQAVSASTSAPVQVCPPQTMDAFSQSLRTGVPIPTVLGARYPRSQRLRINVPVVVRGPFSREEPLEEHTFTETILPQGAIIGLGAGVQMNEDLILANCKTGQQIGCRVVGLLGGQNGKSSVELQFIQPDPQFWHVGFPVASLGGGQRGRAENHNGSGKAQERIPESLPN